MMKLSALPLLIVVPATVLTVRKSWPPLWLFGVLALVVALATAPAIRIWGFGQHAAPFSVRVHHLNETLLQAWRYVALVVWPFGFTIDHEFATDWAWLAGLSTAVVGALAWLARSKWNAPWYAWLWIVGLLVPRGLVVTGASPLTEHHAMIPFIALWLLIGSAVSRPSLRSIHG